MSLSAAATELSLNTVVAKSDRPTVRTSRNAGYDAERQITGRNSK